MAIRKILHYPEPVLQQVAEPVETIDDEIRTLALDMAETMYAAPGVGLAAPQVGVSKRVVVVDCSSSEEEPQPVTLINPEIVERDGEVCEEEGCLSVPGYYAKVSRAARVTVRYLDLEGKQCESQAEGLWAIAFQHELDHLEGTLFVDYLSPLKKSMFRKKYQKILAQLQEQL